MTTPTPIPRPAAAAATPEALREARLLEQAHQLDPLDAAFARLAAETPENTTGTAGGDPR